MKPQTFQTDACWYSCLLAQSILLMASLAAGMTPLPANAQGYSETQIVVATDGFAVDFSAFSENVILNLSVRVVGPSNFVFEKRVSNSILEWIPPDKLADGTYQWEVRTVTVHHAAPMLEMTPEIKHRPTDHWFDQDVTITHVDSGTFRVTHGFLENVPAHPVEGTALSNVKRAASRLLNFIIPAAQASGDFDNFVRIQNPSGSGLTDLRLQGNDQSFSWPNWWRVVNNGDADNRFEIREGQLTTRLTITQGGHTGIGTENPLRRLHVVSPGANNASLYIENDDNHWRLGPGLPDGAFNLWGGDGTMRVRVMQSAPGTSLVITQTGTGFGTGAPTAPIHVQRTNNTSRINVEDTGATVSADIMFHLRNNGNPQFRMENTATDRVWNFRMQDFGECSSTNTCFVVNKRNGPRFRFMQDGDMFIEGAYEQSSSRAIKSAVSALASDELLAKLENLGVYEWSYNHNPDSRHIGPMAEDFYDAFGLGSGDKSISPANLAGVSLAAAGALHKRVTDGENLNQRIQHENQEMQSRLERLEALLVDHL